MHSVARCVIAATVSTQASAQTGISAPGPFERSQAEMLSDALGQTFQLAGEDLVGDSLSARRVSDSEDQWWNAGTYRVEILGRESLFNTKLGYTGPNGNDFERILRTTSGPDRATVTIDTDFAWAVKNAAILGGNVYTSADASNRDGVDHMVTYRLLEGGRSAGFILFFEDWGGSYSDRDFNDLGVLVSLVPLPKASLLAAAALGLAGVGRRR